MHCVSNRARFQVVAFGAIVAGFVSTPALAAELMPVVQQNALVQRYCAVCHTDASRNGGLSLEHFDAAKASPSLIAMLLSKLTGGVSLQTARDAASNPSAATLIEKRMKTGAMAAAGLALPDKSIVAALIRAFTVESTGATEWSIERTGSGAGRMLTASILREAPSANAGEAESYRLVLSCNLAAQQGQMQLAWSPAPQNGTLAASVDGSKPVTYRVEGTEKMGNGNGVALHKPASVELAQARSGLPFPAKSLAISDLFPTEAVTFPFTDLPKGVHLELQACFAAANSSSSTAVASQR